MFENKDEESQHHHLVCLHCQRCRCHHQLGNSWSSSRSPPPPRSPPMIIGDGSGGGDYDHLRRKGERCGGGGRGGWGRARKAANLEGAKIKLSLIFKQREENEKPTPSSRLLSPSSSSSTYQRLSSQPSPISFKMPSSSSLPSSSSPSSPSPPVHKRRHGGCDDFLLSRLRW